MYEYKSGDIWSGEWESNLMKEGILTKKNGDKYQQVFNPEQDRELGVFLCSL